MSQAGCSQATSVEVPAPPCAPQTRTWAGCQSQTGYQAAAAAAVAALFAVLASLGSSHPVLDGLENVVANGVLAFIFLYFMAVALLTFAMLLTGLDFDSSFSAIVASINTTAHGFGPPGEVHNFHALSAGQIWICTAAMLLGRLEIFSVIVLFRPAYWRK